VSARSNRGKANVGVLVAAFLSAGGLLAIGCGSNPSGHGAGGSSGSGGSGSGGSGSGGSTAPGAGGAAGSGAGGQGTGAGGSGTAGATAGTGGGIAGMTGSAGAGAGGTNAGNPTVHLDQPDQMIQGFGINDMFGKTGLPGTLFDPNADIGLSILRVGMDTNGAGNLSDGNATAGDITTVTRMGGKVIGSVWSPPANCKTNNNANNGGQLCSANTIAIPAHGTTANGQTLFSADPGMCPASSNTSCYTSWAQTITKFATTNKLYAMSLANEPEFASGPASEPTVGGYPTTVYTAKEMVEFVKVAGPMLQAAGIKVIAPEASEWNHLWDNHSVCGSVPSGLKSDDPLNCGCFISSSATPSATCQAAAAAPCSAACTSGGNGYDYGHALHADAAAWKALDILGVHEYDAQKAFPWPKSDFPKDKEVWQTEMAGVMWWPEQGPSNNIADGIVVAQWIHSALVVGEASAWLWWWYPGQGDNEGLLANGNADTKRHWTLGNYSKFVRPGYMRVEVSGSAPSNVLLSAYSGPNTVVVVAINSGTSTVSVPISIAGGTAPASCTPWLTSATANLVSQTAVAVTGGAFSASLAGSSVTTFVCK